MRRKSSRHHRWEFSEKESNAQPAESRASTAPTLLPNDADHEVNNEAHKIFRKDLESRPDWRTPIFNYIKNGELPEERWESQKSKAWSSRCCILEEKLYNRSLNEPYLLYIPAKDAFTILKQTHDGSCGSHSSRRSLAIRIKIHGYFWPTIADDGEQFALKCDKCQWHALLIHKPTQKLSSVSSPYPFM